ncbi:MAG TPA: cupin domain-containing protein [Ruminococcaceae bacterium]|nr:cupin domain-containing protein [Oscillospiraceae bacterium]
MIKNLFDAPSVYKKQHGGDGEPLMTYLMGRDDFKTGLQLVCLMQLEPNQSVGEHTHGNDEELYIILEGEGLMTINGEQTQVKAGDVCLNPIGGTHSLVNNSSRLLKVLVLKVDGGKQ